MWAVILIGAGTALTAVWNGAPALYLGAMGRQGYPSRDLRLVNHRGLLGLPLTDNGERGAMRISHPATPFSLIGI